MLLKIIIYFTFLCGLGLMAALTNNSPTPTQNEASPSSSSYWEKYQKADDPVTILLKNCASEAGIPENEPKHAITPDELQVLADCIDRNRY